jgi:hypothetical protein
MFLLNLLLIVLVMGASAALITKATVYFMGRRAGKSIGKLHRSTEFIIETHKIPPLWSEPLKKKIKDIAERAVGSHRILKAKQSARKQCLKQLRRLIMHFQWTSLVVDEEARAIILEGLTSAFEEWVNKNWDEIV